MVSSWAMAKIKYTEPNFFSGRWMKVHLSHSEVKEVCSAAEPALALAGLIPHIGPYLGVGGGVLIWSLKRMKKKSKGRGVDVMIRIPFSGVVPSLLNPLLGGVRFKIPEE